jgi:hypothetical protein
VPLSRRDVVRGAALIGGAASVSGAFGELGPASAAPAETTPSPHAITSPSFFDLSSATRSSFQLDNALRRIASPQTHYQVQGLAIDSTTNFFYIAQAPDPAKPELTMTLNGESWTADGYNQHASGDLVISRFSLQTGRHRDSMYVMGAGHGGQFGIEPAGAHPSLWLETYPNNPKTAGATPRIVSGQVFGTKVARLPYRANRLVTNTQVVTARYTPNPYVVTRRNPVPGARTYSVAIDTSAASGAASGVLVVRYHRNGDPAGAGKWFAAFDLDAARNGDFSSPLASTSEPQELGDEAAHSEGFAVCGQYVYLVGTNAGGVTSLYEIDLNGTPGAYRSKVELPAQGEPESVAVYAPGGVPTKLYYLCSDRGRPRSFDLFQLDAHPATQEPARL